MFNFPLRPEAASTFAGQHDLLFGILTVLTIVFSVPVMILAIIFAVRFRAGNKVDRSRPSHENLKLELTWTIIPLLLALAVFGYSAKLFVDLRKPPKDAMEIFVIGKQWMWHIQHPNGVRENNELHVPIGVPVKLTMISQDVIHAFYIPEFRTQYMVVPDKYTQMWFQATKEGEYMILCNQYCGTQHSEMVGKVIVQRPDEFQKWLADGGRSMRPKDRTMVESGEDLYKLYNCANCHGDVDTPRGPSLYGLYGKRQQMTDGTTVLADDEYLRESLLKAEKKLVAGYIATMPNYEQELSEEQALQLIAYMKTLGVQKPAAPAAPAAATTPREGNR